ncbi:MAG: MoaD/ThiS family protein [Pirellulales bacterium]|nr:MoaD/ThiS family protein [Pirellulales bacterium]
MIRVMLPSPLRALAKIEGELALSIDGPVTMNAVIDAVEVQFPALRGTIRDPATGRRRPYLRYFVCNEDWSDESLDAPLPGPIVAGAEPLLVVGAVSGG